MTKLSMTFAIATLTVSLAPSVQAYAVEPDASIYEQSVVEQINVLFGAATQTPEGICELDLTPVLADALGISMASDAQDVTVALASCEQE